MRSSRLLTKIGLEVGLLLGLTLVAAAATKAFHPGAPAWHLQVEADEWTTTIQQVTDEWSGDVLWVDARTREEFEQGHQNGALHLPLEGWEQNLYEHFDTLAGSARPIVVYCGGERCGKSKEVAKKLSDLGMNKVFYLQGGWDKLK